MPGHWRGLHNRQFFKIYFKNLVNFYIARNRLNLRAPLPTDNFTSNFNSKDLIIFRKEENRKPCDAVKRKTKESRDVVQRNPKEYGSQKKPAGRQKNQAIVATRYCEWSIKYNSKVSSVWCMPIKIGH